MCFCLCGMVIVFMFGEQTTWENEAERDVDAALYLLILLTQ